MEADSLRTRQGIRCVALACFNLIEKKKSLLPTGLMRDAEEETLGRVYECFCVQHDLTMSVFDWVVKPIHVRRAVPYIDIVQKPPLGFSDGFRIPTELRAVRDCSQFEVFCRGVKKACENKHDT